MAPFLTPIFASEIGTRFLDLYRACVDLDGELLECDERLALEVHHRHVCRVLENQDGAAETPGRAIEHRKRGVGQVCAVACVRGRHQGGRRAAGGLVVWMGRPAVSFLGGLFLVDVIVSFLKETNFWM